MKIIAEHTKEQILKNDGIQISSFAKAAKKIDDSVIDGTLGTYYYEDGKFRTHSFVKEIVKSLKDEEMYLYATSSGSPEFQESAIKWLIGQNYDFMKNKMNIKCVATPGGTGAIVNTVNESLDIGQTLLIPSPHWGPYTSIATSRGYKVLKFSLIKNQKFNLEEFKEKCEELIEIQNKVVFILNDPCNNPTGYSMSNDEINQVIDYMNSKSETPFVMIYDCAYIDMAKQGYYETREKIKLFERANDNILISCTVSYSKTFFIYGQRLGAQILISKNEQAVNDFFTTSVFYARSTWSNCNLGMMNLVRSVAKSDYYRNVYFENVGGIIDTLHKRSSIFIKEANEANLEIFPYESGFFIAIPCSNIDIVLKELINECKVYLLPFENCIRVAICSLPLKDIKGLAFKIKDVIEKTC